MLQWNNRNIGKNMAIINVEKDALGTGETNIKQKFMHKKFQVSKVIYVRK